MRESRGFSNAAFARAQNCKSGSKNLRAVGTWNPRLQDLACELALGVGGGGRGGGGVRGVRGGEEEGFEEESRRRKDTRPRS